LNKLSINIGSSVVREPYFGHISEEEATKMKGQPVTFVQTYTRREEGRFRDLSNSFINQALVGEGYQGALGILVSKARDLYKVAYDIYNPKKLREIFDH